MVNRSAGIIFNTRGGVMLSEAKHLAGCRAVRIKNGNTICETLRYAQGDKQTENWKLKSKVRFGRDYKGAEAAKAAEGAKIISN